MSTHSSIPPVTQATIESRLALLSLTHDIKIVYACESGSRAWGFPSPDSDFDIRFIYVHPWTWYLALEAQKDTLEFPLEDTPQGLLDLGGWDLRKTLLLVQKSNPVIWEWLQSPIIYQAMNTAEIPKLRSVLDPFYSPIAACHHYLSLCHRTMERELQAETIKIKKYFYMLRPLLAARWIAQHQSVPPMEFAPLLTLLDDQPKISAAIADLLQRKQVTDEQVPIPRIAVLDHFLREELARLQTVAKKLPAAQGDSATLDALFRQILGV